MARVGDIDLPVKVNQIVSRMKTINAIFKTLLLVLLCMMIRDSAAAAGDCQDCIRDFRVVVVDTSGKVDKRENTFKMVGFSNWFYKGEWEGKPAYFFKREEKTDRGDRVFHTLIMAPDYSPIISERKFISHTGKTIYERKMDFRDPVFNFSPNTFSMNALGTLAHKLDLSIGAVNNCFIISGPGRLPMKISLTVEEEEMITVPAGTFPCLRLRLEYGYEQFIGEKWAFASALLKPFAPDYFIWIEKQAPHGMVKMQGKFGAPGSVPEQAYELIKVRSE